MPNATDNPNTSPADDVLFSSYFGCSSTGEKAFLLKTSVRPPPNKHFYQKQTFGTRRTSIFIKNKRSAPAEQTFLSKTNVRHLPNKHFYQKQAFGTCRTSNFLKNECSAPAEHPFSSFLVCCTSATTVVCLRNNRPCPPAMHWHVPFSCPKHR